MRPELDSKSDVDSTLIPPATAAVDLPDVPPGFGFSEEHELLRKSARRLLADRNPFAAVRKLVDDDVGFDRELYREMLALGWLESGLDGLSRALLFEEMGRSLLPSPYFATLVALRAIEAAGSAEQRARLEPPIRDGSMIATIALAQPIATRAEPIDDGYELSGETSHVLFLQSAGLLVIPCREPSGGLGWYTLELPTTGASIEAELSVDSTRRMARLRLEAARVPASARLEQNAKDTLTKLETAALVWLAAEMIGAADAVLEKTQSYAIERQQFGKAIGAFQAVKHPIVDMMVSIELGRSLALAAACLLDRNGYEAETTARMAKAMASDLFAFAVKKAVQLHGGFGFTWDCDIHFYFKRMLWSRGTLGDGPHHRQRLAARLLGTLR